MLQFYPHQEDLINKGERQTNDRRPKDNRQGDDRGRIKMEVPALNGPYVHRNCECSGQAVQSSRAERRV